MIKMSDINIKNKRVLIRLDLNVPIKNGEIISDVRIKSSLPTIKEAIKKGAYVMIISHFGNPKEGIYDIKYSLKPIFKYLQNKLSFPIRFVKNYLDGIKFNNKELLLLENVRFNIGEKKNDKFLAKKYASLCDIFIMDAFGVSHRIQSSTYGLSKYAKIACCGPLLCNEIKSIKKSLYNPIRPMVAIVGGSKISTKLNILNYLSKVADDVIVGGGIANTFISAKGYNIGKSIYEKKLISEAKILLKNTNIHIPNDVLVAKKFSETAISNCKFVKDIKENEIILDVGPNFNKLIFKILKNAKTILWNGPLGVFEFNNFSKSTENITNIISNSKAFSIAGGGETIAAIDYFKVNKYFSYISTGGGAFLKLIEGKKLPVINILEKRINHNNIYI